MYFKYSEEEIRKELNEKIIINKAILEAWKKVEIKKKKDGTEYKELTKNNLINAKATKIPLYKTNSANGYAISPVSMTVYTCSGVGYVNDSIYIYDIWKEGMDETRKINIKTRCSFQYNTAEEIRTKIQMRIEKIEDTIINYEDALNRLHEVYELYIAELKETEKRMKNNCRGNEELYRSMVNLIV